MAAMPAADSLGTDKVSLEERLETLEQEYETRLAATEEWRSRVTEWLEWEHAQLGRLLAVLTAIGGAAGAAQVGRLPDPPRWPLSD